MTKYSNQANLVVKRDHMIKELKKIKIDMERNEYSYKEKITYLYKMKNYEQKRLRSKLVRVATNLEKVCRRMD